MTTAKPANVNEYVASFPKETQQVLMQIRNTIHNTVPEAEETISYGMPTFKLRRKNLIHFAVYKNHISLYPFTNSMHQLDAAFASYKTSGKGTIQFPLVEAMPLHLIEKMIVCRVKETMEKGEDKKEAGKKEVRKTF
jgi:uncharacterized protein YdhG (YjbR/CyaY superfamily)